MTGPCRAASEGTATDPARQLAPAMEQAEATESVRDARARILICLHRRCGCGAATYARRGRFAVCSGRDVCTVARAAYGAIPARTLVRSMYNTLGYTWSSLHVLSLRYIHLLLHDVIDDMSLASFIPPKFGLH
jgi:hypothetical protein